MESAKLQQEFEKAYDTWSEPIFRHCFFRLRNREAAKELTQDTFMRTWDYLRKGQSIDNIKAFLYKVANNLIINESQRKRPAASLEKLFDDTGFEPEAKEGTFEILERKEILEKLEELEPNYRDAIFMRYVDELPVKEIARMLGETESNISVKIHRGLKKLKEIYNKR